MLLWGAEDCREVERLILIKVQSRPRVAHLTQGGPCSSHYDRSAVEEAGGLGTATDQIGREPHYELLVSLGTAICFILSHKRTTWKLQDTP